MTQSEFTKLVAGDVNAKYKEEGKKPLTNDNVKDVINSFTTNLCDQVAKGEKISISGFGSFEAIQKSARTGRNPITGDTIQIPARKAPKFKAAKAFKDLINA